MTIAFSNKKKILLQIKQGNEDALVKIYLKYKKEFIGWAVKYFNLRHEECEDIYQDTILVFRQNIVSNKLVEMNSSIKTYLFAVGKNIALKKVNRASRQLSDEQIKSEPATENEEIMDSILEYNETHQLIAGLVNKLKEPNRSILKMFYYQNLSMSEIAKKLNYKNDKVVKAQKVRCMNELKQMVRDLCLKDDLKD